MLVRFHSSSRAAKKTLGRPHWTLLGLLLIACNERLAVLDPPLETTNAGASGVEPEPTQVYSERQLADQAATLVLWTKCGQCHSPAADAQYSAGIDLVTVGLDQQVETGLIVPLSSATSPIVVVMRNGSMPPPGRFDGDAGITVTEADIEAVASFIDNPRFWPNSPPPAIVDAGLAPPTSDAGADGG